MNEKGKPSSNNKKHTIKTKFSQSQLPRFTLKESLVIAEALRDQYATKPTLPLQLAKAVDVSPSSTNWRYLTGASSLMD
jgi:hypothetical protein